MKVICNPVREEKNTPATAAAAPHYQSEITGLVEEAVSGNFTAFGELHSIYLDRIYRYVFYQVKDRMTAEDITEEVFLKAWRAIKSCKGKEKTFSSWLYRIAHNHMVNALRNTKKFTPIEEVEIIDPKQEIGADIEYRELLKMLDCLPKNQRQIIMLKFIEGLENREIVKITGKTEGAIRVMQMRALMALKQKLDSEPKSAKAPLTQYVKDKV
jgi:RNA polymerase sigma-70 factor (ECF subfamily)